MKYKKPEREAHATTYTHIYYINIFLKIVEADALALCAGPQHPAPFIYRVKSIFLKRVLSR